MLIWVQNVRFYVKYFRFISVEYSFKDLFKKKCFFKSHVK
jgi:hypothetical protein